MAATEFNHLSVLPEETIACLAPRTGEVYLDGTVGGGGHARLILEASAPDGRLIGLDRDPDALQHATRILAPYGTRVSLHHACFADLATILDSLDIAAVDGILFDLGVSSWQLDSADRGFSFRQDGPLDMRMDPTRGESAADIVNQRDEAELVRIFREYGEERFAGRIARRIVQLRQETPFTRTTELAEMVRDLVPGGKIPARIHPATRIFQALRIEVNGELEQAKDGISSAFQRLKIGGRLAIISFHSLEDRIVKQTFQQLSTGCNCPPKLPLCVCGRTPVAELLTRRGIKGSAEDSDNPRARSAVLRAIRKSSN